jgi:hypothetical protein
MISRTWGAAVLHPYNERLDRADVDAAGDGVDFHSSRGIADVGAQGMFALLFDDYRKAGADIAGHGFRREQESSVRGYPEIYRAGDAL